MKNYEFSLFSFISDKIFSFLNFRKIKRVRPLSTIELMVHQGTIKRARFDSKFTFLELLPLIVIIAALLIVTLL